MSEAERAIALFERQKAKINKSLLSLINDEVWRGETERLVEEFIGRNTQAFIYISGHSFRPVGTQTAKEQRQRGIDMVDYCINEIKTIGIKKTAFAASPTNDFITDVSSAIAENLAKLLPKKPENRTNATKANNGLTHRQVAIIRHYKIEAKCIQSEFIRTEIIQQFGKKREQAIDSVNPNSKTYKPVKAKELESIIPYLEDCLNAKKAAENNLAKLK